MPYTAPGAEVSFGDIFDADFLFDVFLRCDAERLGKKSAKGGNIAYSASFADDRTYVLGHGEHFRSILISESCWVDTALGHRQGHRARGRLLFAPILPAETDALDSNVFGRFPVPAWEERFGAGIAELRRCFMVDARDVRNHRGARVASLTDEASLSLEANWAAYASRRGPMASGRNAEKVAELLARGHGKEYGAPEDLLAGHIADATALGWHVEGECLEAIATALAAGHEGTSEVDQLEGALRQLADSASEAANAIAGYRAK